MTMTTNAMQCYQLLQCYQLVAMNTNLNMDSHKIINLTDPTNNTDATNKNCIDNIFFYSELADFLMVVCIYQLSHVSGNEAPNIDQMQGYVVEQGNPYVKTRFNKVNNKIIDLADPENDGDAISKSNFNTVIKKYQLKPSHKTDQFKYLMNDTFE